MEIYKFSNFKSINSIKNLLVLLLLVLIRINTYIININILHTSISVIILSVMCGYLLFNSYSLKNKEFTPIWVIVHTITVGLLWFSLNYALLCFVVLKMLSKKSTDTIKLFSIFAFLICLSSSFQLSVIRGFTIVISLLLLKEIISERWINKSWILNTLISTLVIILSFVLVSGFVWMLLVSFLIMNSLVEISEKFKLQKVLSTVSTIFILDFILLSIIYQYKINFDKTSFDYYFVLLTILISSIVILTLLVLETIMIIISTKLILSVEKVSTFSFNIKDIIIIYINKYVLIFDNFTAIILHRKLLNSVRWRYRAH